MRLILTKFKNFEWVYSLNKMEKFTYLRKNYDTDTK